jgi:DNA polymerase III sliding clamp (beta) subunit (PCNA family)
VSVKLTLNKELFVQKFLLPISKLADNVSLIPEGDELYAVCSSQDGSIVLLATLKLDTTLDGIVRINLPDVKKFVRLLECIEDNNIELTLEDNHIKYNTSNFKFNYFLLEDSYMQRCPVNPTKIKSLKYDSGFLLPNTKFNEVLKGSSIATDSDKLYFYTKNEEVYAELNDYERQNINNLTYLVTDKFVGEPIKNALPLNLENIRMLAGLRVDSITVKINNTLKVTLFEVEDRNVNIKFVISALVK